MTTSQYKVLWTSYARVALANMQAFKVDSMNVFRRSKIVLSEFPHHKFYGISNFPSFDYNGYYWILIGNVIIIYRVDHEYNEVYVDACFFANTAASHQVFWSIEPEEK